MSSLKRFLLNLFIIASFCSCDKINNLGVEALAGRWAIAGSGDYESFEFTEDFTYFIYQFSSEGEKILSGDYEFTDFRKVAMYNFGLVKITDIDEESIKFILTLDEDPDTEIELSGTKIPG